MLGPLLRFLSACSGAWQTSPAPAAPPSSGPDSEGRDGLLWWRDLARCAAGDLSAALVQANQVLEDQCCIHSAPPLGTVLGLFDGHAGHRAARFACDHFVPNLRGTNNYEHAHGWTRARFD
jgi:pyruvate dehydrogenase phosphatase